MVISTASWELIEPTEGKFDFSSVDEQVALPL
jgi:beta-galactosidase GanA